MEKFRNREDAGRQLVPLLERYRSEHPLVLALPGGGVPIGWEIARALRAPLDVLVVRKVGAPIQPELGMGALAEGGARFIDPHVVRAVGASAQDVEQIIEREAAELERRVRRYRQGRPLPDVRDRTVLLVDDGIATGGTVRAASRALRARAARKIVIAVPVAAAETAEMLRSEADEVVCARRPAELWAIGHWYTDFDQVSEEEVIELLARARHELGEEATMPLTKGVPQEEESSVVVQARAVTLEGNLRVPVDACGIVLFAHGSGSSRFSPRNRFVADALNEAGLATLLLDLLTKEEEARDELDAHLRFDIGFLADRVVAATDWLLEQPATRHLRIGYFGASTGAAAALVAAEQRADHIAAVVSRGGRPDLAGEALRHVRAPTLLIVGERDFGVLDLNQTALTLLPGEKQLVIVPRASHLFEEPGALDKVARLAADWFARHLAAEPHRRPPRHG